MTLLLPEKKERAVFDLPAFNRGGKGFIARRFIGLPGRPVLAEKNLPVSPAFSYSSRKCYSPQLQILFKLVKENNGVADFRPATRFQIPENDDYTSHFEPVFSGIKMLKSRAIFSIANLPKEKFSGMSEFSIPKIEKQPKLQSGILALPGAAFMFPDYSMQTGSKFSSFKSAIISDFVIRRNQNRINENSIYNKKTRELSRIGFIPFSVKTEKISSILNRLKFKNLFTESFDRSPLPGNFRINSEDIFNAELETQKSLFHPAEVLPHFKADELIAREFISNLFLEYEVGFKPSSTLKTADFKPVFRISPVISSHSNLFQARNNFNVLPSFSEKPEPANALPAPPFKNLQISHNFINLSRLHKPEFQFVLKSSEQKAILKLKLRLTRLRTLSRPGFFQPLLSTFKAAPFLPPDSVLKTEYLPLKKEDRNCLNSSRPFVSALSDNRINFRQIRSIMTMLAGAHTRYCIRRLKRIFSESLKKKEVSHHAINRMTVSSDSRLKITFFNFSQVRPEPLTSILLRPFSFLMTVTSLNFTDICLPLHRRRTAPDRGFFVFNYKGNLIRKRKSSLRTLRFKLEPESPENYIASAYKTARKLYFKHSYLPVKPAETWQAGFSEQLWLNQASRQRAHLPAYRGRLERFKPVDSIPFEIIQQLPLDISIIPISPTGCLPQKHFIIPAGWQKNPDKFRCRMRLAPYPFGFPVFLPENNPFRTLLSVQHLPQIFEQESIKKCPSSFYFNNFYSPRTPFSMKNPRRWLFSELKSSDLAGHFFKTQNSGPYSNLKQPLIQRNLKHPWQFLKKASTVKTSLFLNNACKQILVETEFRHFSRIAQPRPSQIAFRIISKLPMPLISKVLLRVKKIKVNRHVFVDFNSRILTTLRGLNAAFRFSGAESPQLIEAEEKLLLFNCFPESFKQNLLKRIKKAKEKTVAGFKARFRGLRFPYRPEIHHTKSGISNFKEPPESPHSMENSFTEGVRISELFLDSLRSAGILFYDEGFYASDYTDCNHFKIKSELKIKEKPFARKDHDLRIPAIPFFEFKEFFDRKRFLTPCCTNYYRIRKVFKLDKSAFAYLIQDFICDKYSTTTRINDSFTLKRKLSHENPHLVIMFKSKKQTFISAAAHSLSQKRVVREKEGFSNPGISEKEAAFPHLNCHLSFFKPLQAPLHPVFKSFSFYDPEILNSLKVVPALMKAPESFSGSSIKICPIISFKNRKKQENCNISPVARILEPKKPVATEIKNLKANILSFSLSITSKNPIDVKLPSDKSCTFHDPYLPEWQEMSSKKEVMNIVSENVHDFST